MSASSAGVPARIGVVIAAGGTGSRFGDPAGKQLATVAGRPVVAWSIAAIAPVPGVRAIALVCHPERVAEFAERAIEEPRPGADVMVVPGGATRQASVAAGIAALPSDCDVIVVHDGARPLVSTQVVEAAVSALLEDDTADGVIVGHPSVDTLKCVAADGTVLTTPDRALFWAVQTPQVFRAAALRFAHERAAIDGFEGTDDASLIERFGGRVIAVEGPRDNIKVTRAEDLVVADAVLRSRRATTGHGSE